MFTSISYHKLIKMKIKNTKTIKVQILNAFVDNNKGGNPAGVVLDADNLSSANKLEIAKKSRFIGNSFCFKI